MFKLTPTPRFAGLSCRVIPQRGSALIIALVFLLAMTLIGVTAMQGTTQQESMAGNMRNRNLAFQAAEAALREAENIILGAGFITPVHEAIDPCSLVDPDSCKNRIRDPDAYDWNAATNYTSSTLTGVNAPPRYHIRFVSPLGTGRSGTYRVTAQGIGGTADAQVVLQTAVRRFDE